MGDRYSLSRKDKKLAGVCSTLGDVFAIDPTIIRIGFAALAIIVSWKLAIVGYVGAGIWLHMKKRQALRGDMHVSDFDRMADVGKRRSASIKTMRDTLDVNDRRMMAIDHHLNAQNDQLAREIEALREDK